MINQDKSGRTKGPALSFAFDVLFGSGIVLFFAILIHAVLMRDVSCGCRSGVVSYGIALSACYAFVLLCITAFLAGLKKSFYGTPLLNQYLSLSLWCTVCSGVAIAVMGYMFHERQYDSFSGFFCVSSAVSLVVLFSNLALVRGLSSALRRQERFPVLEGCSFLYVGDRQKADMYRSNRPYREKRGCHAFFYDLGDSVDFQEVLEGNFVEKAVFMDRERYAELVRQCAVQGIEVWLPPAGREVEDFAEFEIQRNAPRQSLFKFALDRFAGLVLIALTSPVWIVAAIGIRLADKGPIFYQQARSGLYGKHFRMWKFRTMYTDAEKRLDEIKSEFGNEMEGPIFKLSNDPRIFRFGHILRKLSIDELPQLINVLLGDMSLVGPRPLPVYETEEFEKIEHRRRLCVQPGLTCYWQIEGRSDITNFDELIALDDQYIDEYGSWTDIKLLLKTIPAVLFAKGAK